MPQNNKIKIRRGLNSAIPAANTEVGELRYSTDTKELFIDDGSANVKIGGDPTNFPVSTAQQAALNAKANASDTVNLTGDQTVAGVKTFTSAPIAPSGTSIGEVLYLTGTGFPNGVVTAPVGSIYIDTAVTNGASSWIKKSGTGNTGWKVLEGDTGLRDITSLSNATSGKLFVYRTAQGIVFIAEDLIIPSTATTTWGVIAGPIATAIGQFEIARAYNDTVQDSSNRLFINNSNGIRGWQAAGASYRYNFTTPPLKAAALTPWPTTLPGVSA